MKLTFQIDDAVEVKQITKTNDKETRRHLGVRKLGINGRTVADMA